MPAKKFLQYLEEQGIKHALIRHAPAVTSQEVAAQSHIPGWEVAKTVIVKLDGKLAMAVLPAPAKIDFNLLRQATGAQHAELASEEEFAGRFPDCEVGAMPPFGNLYGMPVYVDASLTEDEQIAFNACSHAEVVRMAYADFARLVKPKVVHLTAHAVG